MIRNKFSVRLKGFWQISIMIYADQVEVTSFGSLVFYNNDDEYIDCIFASEWESMRSL